jgi:hypothetical protein
MMKDKIIRDFPKGKRHPKLSARIHSFPPPNGKINGITSLYSVIAPEYEFLRPKPLLNTPHSKRRSRASNSGEASQKGNVIQSYTPTSILSRLSMVK